jgi:tetratricopeptide (TPR) repeat protein
VLSAIQLHERALQASHAGRHGSARRLLARASRRGPDSELATRIAVSLAYLDAEHGRLDDGLARCAEALTFEGATPRARGLVFAQRGLLLMRAGDVPAALESFTSAEPLLAGRDSRDDLASLHLNRGNVHLQCGDLDAAGRDFERCIRLSAEGSLPAARAGHNLGYVHLQQGDLVAALRRMDEARPVLAPVSAVSRAICAQDRAEVLLAAGLVDEAVGALREAVAAFGARGLRQQQGEAELVLARTLSRSGRPTEARAVARRAMRRFERRGATTWALRAELVALNVDHAPPPTAASHLCAVSAKLAAAGLRTEALIAEQSAARALVRAGDLGAARELASRRLPAAAAPVQRIGHSLLKAELAQRGGRPAEARRSLRAGLDALDAWQTTFGSLDLQTALSGHGRALAELGLRLALADGRPAVVLEWVERARALAARVTSVRPPADPAVAEDLAALRSLGEEDPVATARLQERVRAQAWLGIGAARRSPAAPLHRVQEALAERDGTLVAHLVLDGRVSALVVTSSSATVHPLGSQLAVDLLLRGLQADLDVAASRLPQAMRQVVRNSLDRRLAALSQEVWAGLPGVSEGPLVLVPSGALASVPWACLPQLSGRPLTVARSATSWLGTRHTPRPRRVGLVAGPGVARAVEEVHNAGRAWQTARVLTGAAATASQVSRVAAEVDLLHVAAHGRHSADSPLFSGLELVDGTWHGYDIDQLPQVPQLVVLSACELGRSAVRWGAETLGATVAWQHAGAACVIASPTRVGDDVACEVLTATHTALAAGRSPSDALAAARASADTEGVVPFTCFGAGW